MRYLRELVRRSLASEYLILRVLIKSAYRKLNELRLKIKNLYSSPKKAPRNPIGYRKLILSISLKIITFSLLPISILINLALDLKMAKQNVLLDKFRWVFNNSGNPNFVFLAPIDWEFRYQRPQQLSVNVTRLGRKVLYLNPTIRKGSSSKSEIKIEEVDEVLVGTIYMPSISKYIGVNSLNEVEGRLIASLLEQTLFDSKFGSTIIVLQQPGWYELVNNFRNNRIVYDCMDDTAGFKDISPNILELEQRCKEIADTIIVSSVELYHKNKTDIVKPHIVRNGCDPKHFRKKSNFEIKNTPIVGYFGAIAEWFDYELVAELAKALPEINFELIGNVTHLHAHQVLGELRNVRFLGEINYRNLPEHIQSWKAGLLPFKLNNLTLATNPVKVYEYAAAGIPTISTNLPEVKLFSEKNKLILSASTNKEFIENVSIIANSPLLKEDIESLVQWAEDNNWENRAKDFINFSCDVPKVTVIILMWNNAELTIKCLESVQNCSDYPNFNIILIDNASEIEEFKKVENWITKSHSDIRVIRNDLNYGFAKGFNIGIREAYDSDYFVILNNDTEVTPGWITKSLRYFKTYKNLGILGPSTNNIGNEAKINLHSQENDWISEIFNRFISRKPKILNVENIAFFCVFVPKSTIDKVGLLDEDFGRGYFEDDDYCKRVILENLNVGIARDVFVLHEHGASFSKLSKLENEELFKQNLAIYEKKWGKWRGHNYKIDLDQF